MENDKGTIKISDDIKGLDISTVYKKHIDLYLHLDKLIWTSIAGIAGIVLAVFSILLTVAKNSDINIYFPYISLLPLFILLVVIRSYMNTISKLNRGKDFICVQLKNIEDESGLFSKKMDIPSELGETHVSFFSRRASSIKKKGTGSNTDIDEKRRSHSLLSVLDVLSACLTVALAINVIAVIVYVLM